MRSIFKSINQKLKQSPNESIIEIFGETQTVLSLKQPPNLLSLLSINRKNYGYVKVCLIVIIKTVNYVHYISNLAPVSRHQMILFSILGVT